MTPDTIVDSGARMCFGPSPKDKPLPKQFKRISYELTDGLENRVTCPSLGANGSCLEAGGEICIFKKLAGGINFEGSPVLLVGAAATDLFIDQIDRTVTRVPAGRLPTDTQPVALSDQEWNTFIELVKNAGDFVPTPILVDAAFRDSDTPPPTDSRVRSSLMHRTLRSISAKLDGGRIEGVAPLLQTEKRARRSGSRLVMPRNLRAA